MRTVQPSPLTIGCEVYKRLITQINTEFRVLLSTDNKKARIIGAGQLHKHIGTKKANKAFRKALLSDLDKYTFKCRSGLKIDFYTK